MKKKELFAGCACGCFFSLVVAVVLPLALVVCSGVAAYGKYESLAEKTKQVREKSSGQEFETVWRWGDGDENSPSVARLRLDGEISHERIGRGLFGIDEEFSEHPLVAKIKAVEADSSFDGIWLDIDSPGGEVTLSDEIRHRLESFRKSRKGRFVFARFGAMACSGGYYVATAADCIMAAPTCWTGSIGVIVPAVNAAGLAEKIGVKSVNIASSSNKALLDPISPVRQEHVDILQRAVDQAYERFVGLVSKSRNIPADALRSIADGRILTAKDALDAKLIDFIGYEEDAFAKVEELAAKAVPESKGVRIFTLEDSTPNLYMNKFLRRFSGVSSLLGSGRKVPSASGTVSLPPCARY